MKILIKGSKSSGKTCVLNYLLSYLRTLPQYNNLLCSGIFGIKTWRYYRYSEDDLRIIQNNPLHLNFCLKNKIFSYNILSQPLSAEKDELFFPLTPCDFEKAEEFFKLYFDKYLLKALEEEYNRSLNYKNSIFIIDELGRLENNCPKYLTLLEKIFTFDFQLLIVLASPKFQHLKEKIFDLTIDLDKLKQNGLFDISKNFFSPNLFEAFINKWPLNFKKNQSLIKPKINIVLMASGFAKRFGANKLFLPLYDKSALKNHVLVVEHIIDELYRLFKSNLISDGLKNIFVVSSYEEILKMASQSFCIPVFNRHSAIGISESIKSPLLLQNIAGDFLINKDEYILYMVADQPAFNHTLILKIFSFLSFILNNGKNIRQDKILLSCFSSADTISLDNWNDYCSWNNSCKNKTDLWANPVLFAASYIPDLLNLNHEQGGKSIFCKYPDHQYFLPTLENFSKDIDKTDDFLSYIKETNTV